MSWVQRDDALLVAKAENLEEDQENDLAVLALQVVERNGEPEERLSALRTSHILERDEKQTDWKESDSPGGYGDQDTEGQLTGGRGIGKIYFLDHQIRR